MEKIIKKISTYSKPKGGGKEFLNSVQEFSKTGKLLVNKEYDADENLVFESKIEYNESDLTVKEINNHIFDGFEEVKLSTYDENNKLIEEKNIFHGGDFSIKKYIKNEDDNSLEIIIYDEDNEIEESSKLFFNDNNKIIEKANFNEKGKLTDKTVFTYDDANDKILRKDELNKKGKPEKSIIYHYDEAERLIGITSENRKGKLTDWVKIEYDENNNPIMQETMAGVVVKTEYSGNETIEKHYNASGNLINETTVVKDESGNTIKESDSEKEQTLKYEFY